MTARGLAKLIEECGEVQQIAAKKLAYYTTDEHPDGAGSLNDRLRDECADVMAAILFVADQFGFDGDDFHKRIETKLGRFNRWHAMTDNNSTGIDAKEST